MKNIQSPRAEVRTTITRQLTSIRRRLASAVGALALCALLLLGASLHSAASPALTYVIILYTVSGPVDVTATYSLYENHVYDPDGQLVGTVNSSSQIEDSNNQVIGSIGGDQVLPPGG